MGKDQDLLDAARCGNSAVVERILCQRAKKSGPLASLRRGLGPNVQDNNGYTPLHHACLNGHKEIVTLLLEAEASANIVDNKGCTPLHLASWSGSTDIVKVLLTQGPSFPSVNYMNLHHESALHSAAQYGHTEIVKLLLENRCYPSVRNVRNESPLDLAAQYGRLDTVECLLNFYPGLLSDIVRCHSPLHLAAKNGHKHVVKSLLDSGFDINYMTDIGTALHEAAMYGKLEVVKLLLDYGVDPTLENSRKRTVFDILGDLNTNIAKQIEDVIKDTIALIKLGSDDSLSSPQEFSAIESPNISEITPPRQFCSPDFDESVYDVVPLPRLLVIQDSERLDSCPDEQCLEPPFITSKRYSDPLNSIYQNVKEVKDTHYIDMSPLKHCNRSQPPEKPPRKSVSPHRNSYEFLCFASSGKCSNGLMPSKSTPALHASRHQVLSPPSPATAEMGIHHKIHPKISKKSIPAEDSETLTDEQLVATLGPYGEIELTLSTDNKSVSTETSTSVKNQFAGLHHGSTSSSQNRFHSDPPTSSINKSNLSLKSHNIYENVHLTMEQETNSSKVILSVKDSHLENAGNCFSVLSPFDEKAEWAEIAGIMATFGGSISRESVFTQDMETNFSQSKSESDMYQNYCCYTLEQWLSQIGLLQYENLLILNGFDDVNFLGGNIIEDADLQEIGIRNSAHRQRLCSAAQKLPFLQPLCKYKNTDRFPKDVDEWLQSLNLLEYSDNFSNNNITDINRVLKLWEVELNTVLKIPKLGHRKRILASLGDKHLSDLFDTKDFDLSKLAKDFCDLEMECNFGKSSKENFSDHIEDNATKSNLRIRSPSQLMNDSYEPDKTVISRHQWRHHPDELVINRCNYIAKYLGSTLVKELCGLESTKASIQKLKTSTKDIGKIPSIILSISYLGVQFIDAETQQLVCEHEIRNIHCACQDADDLLYFAYITKEHQTHNHYCHVFSSHTVEMASEIILTLGQAFEVAYQMAIRNKSSRAESGKEIQKSSRSET